MKKHSFQLRVRYEETDKMGFAYYGKYFTWFEVARSELFRACGLPYTEYEKKDMYLPVVEASCKYETPLTYDDLIEISVWISGIKNASIFFHYEISKDGKVTATGKTAHAFINKNKRPVRVPEEVRKVYEGGAQ